MNKKLLFALWGVLFVLCAGLGFLSEPEGVLKGLMVALSLVFFVPGLLLVRLSAQAGDRHTLKLIRNLAVASLVLTVALLIVNFLSVNASETLGNVLYSILIIISSPMICSQYWGLSLFFWAYLMIAAMTKLKAK